MEKDNKFLKVVKALCLPWIALAFVSIISEGMLSFITGIVTMILLAITLICMIIYFVQVRQAKKEKR